MSLLDAYDLVIGIDTEYVSGENLDGVPYDENAVLSYQAFYFHPATGKSNGGYYMTNGPGRRNRHALTSLISRIINGALRDGVDIHGDWKASVAKAQAEKPRRKSVEAEEPAHSDHGAFHASRSRHVFGLQEPEEILRPRQGNLRQRQTTDHPRDKDAERRAG